MLTFLSFAHFFLVLKKDIIYQGKEDTRAYKKQIYHTIYIRGINLCHKGKEEK